LAALKVFAKQVVGKKALVINVVGIATDVKATPADSLLAANRAKAVVAALKALGVKAIFTTSSKVSGSQRVSQVTASWKK
jgi:CMP-2-keto-3-deoxyoctulosonic acid synthetase